MSISVTNDFARLSAQ